MDELYILKEALFDSLGEFDTIKERKLKMGELEALKYLTGTLKNICMIDEDDGYSQRGYNDGNNYANRGKHYVRGHYSRDGEMSMARRDERSKHSRDGGITEMIYSAIEQVDNPRVKEHLEKALREAERQ